MRLSPLEGAWALASEVLVGPLEGAWALASEVLVGGVRMLAGEAGRAWFASLVSHDIEYRRGLFPLKESGGGSPQAG